MWGSDFGNALKWMAIFAFIGFIGAIGAGAYFIYWLIKHLQFV
jgi:hypothetical protein